MVSINYTAANATALASLRATNASLQQTQNRIASGLKVASAADDATVWATATSLKSTVATNEARISSINTTKSAADVASAALNVVNDLLGKLQSALAQADANPPANYTAITSTVATLQNQIISVVNNSTVGKLNLLTATAATDVTIGYDNQSTPAAVKVSLAITNILAATGNMKDATTADTSLDAADVTALLGKVKGAQTDMAALSATMAGFSKSLETQTDFLKTINDIQKSAISSLVDADMEEESAKVQALQVKQQLAYQAISIGNSSSQNILRLFQ